MSDPSQPLPQWLELTWPQPVVASNVQLIFDTGLHRPLTFSLANAYTALMKWGQPQPETVRDYTIERLVNGQWQTVAAVVGNYQRRRTHPLDDRAFSGLRIAVTATNGIDHARICEVRVEVEGRHAVEQALLVEIAEGRQRGDVVGAGDDRGVEAPAVDHGDAERGGVPPDPFAVMVVAVCPKQIVGFVGAIVTTSEGLKVTRTVSQTRCGSQLSVIPQTT